MKFQSYPAEGRSRYFAEAPMLPEDERFHPIPHDARYNWSETNMFGFNIPEHSIDCLIWFIYWPKIGATYGGVTLWQGFKSHHLDSEVFDFRVALPLPQDNTSWSCPNGITINMVEPLRAFEISYREPDGDTRFNLSLTAVMPPALRYNGNHITQAMKTRGSLHLGTVDYEIDGYYSRDRSWHEHRNEGVHSVPPLSWIAGVFGDDFAFHLTAFESGNRRPEWAGLYDPSISENNVLWGYVWDQGRLLGIDSADMIIERQNGIAPMAAKIILGTQNGDIYHIQGKTIALNPAMGWPNIATNYALTEWHCKGRTGWGDIQDVMFRDHRRMLARTKKSLAGV